MILVSFSYHSRAFYITSELPDSDQYVIRGFTTAESDGAISDVVCTEMNESRTALECALRCECRVKKLVKSL